MQKEYRDKDIITDLEAPQHTQKKKKTPLKNQEKEQDKRYCQPLDNVIYKINNVK